MSPLERPVTKAGNGSGVTVCVDYGSCEPRVTFRLPATPHPRIARTDDPLSRRTVVTLGNAAADSSLQASLLAGDESRLQSLPAVSAAIIWDGRADRLTVATDRLANLSLCWRRQGDRLVVATSAARVADRWPEPAVFDLEAASEILWLGYTVSDATLFRGVSRVPSASILRFDGGGTSESRYWTPRFSVGPGQPVDDTLDVFRSSVCRATAGPRTSIALSGGIDTRAILASTISLDRSVDGFTAGRPDSADVRVARRLARHLKGEWHNVVIGDDFLDRFDRWAEATVRLSDGTLGVENAHLAYLNERLPSLTDTLVDGGGAEASKRGLLHSAAVKARDSGELADAVLDLFSRPDAAQALLGPECTGRAAERLRELLRQRLAALAHDSVGDTLDAFFLRHMWSGYHGAGIAMQNEHVGCRLPFLDNQLLDALMDVPLAVRGRSALNFLAVRRFAPELQRYPRVWMDVEIPWSDSPLLSLIPPIAVRVVHKLLNRPAFPIARWIVRNLREQARAAAESFAQRGGMACGALRAALARVDVPAAGTMGRAARMAWRFDIWHREFLDSHAQDRHPPLASG